MTKRAEELWEKHADTIACGVELEPYNAFCAALTEYGAEVRRRDAEVCRREIRQTGGDGIYRPIGFLHSGNTACAAAIEREPLP